MFSVSVSFQPNPDTVDLKLRRGFVDLACEKGVSHDCHDNRSWTYPLIFSNGVGGEVQRPLAIVVVGGLITSTILTLLVIPSIYRWFAKYPEAKLAQIEKKE